MRPAPGQFAGRAIAVVALIVGVWALGVALPWHLRATSEPASPATVAPTAPAATSAGDRPEPGGGPDTGLGFQLTAHHAPTAGRALRVMDRLHRAGARWVRVDVGWNTLQPDGPTPFSQWYADLLDQVLAGAHARGLKVIVALWQTPRWASPNGSDHAPPTNVRAYADAAATAAQRWGGDVDAWEIWNEPNFADYFEGADPATYTKLLCAAYPAIKEHDDSPVLFGGLMYNDDAWLERAYRAGARGCFDALAVHPYVGPSNAAPDTPAVGEVWRLTHMPAMRAVMDDWGDRHKKIWITELGWSSGPDSEGNPWDLPVSQPQQARFLGEAVRLVRARYPYVGPIIWYSDTDGPTRTYQDGFGLLRHDLGPKPALRAFAAAAWGR